MLWSNQECFSLVPFVNNDSSMFEYAWCLDSVDFNVFLMCFLKRNVFMKMEMKFSLSEKV